MVWERTDDGQWTSTRLNDNDIALETWRWCADFVAPLDLCPWAAASVNTQGALQFYLSRRTNFKMAVEEAAQRLYRDVKTGNVDPNVAITFVVSLDRDWDFSEFYDWFDELEETFEFKDEYSTIVTLAPFHPDWQFGDGPPELDMEKRSPHPTVTVVCTSVIDKATAEQIGHHNEQVLLDLGISNLRRLYHTKVFLNNKNSPSLVPYHLIPLLSAHLVHVIVELGFVFLTSALSILSLSWSLLSHIILFATVICTFFILFADFKWRRHLVHRDTRRPLQAL